MACLHLSPVSCCAARCVLNLAALLWRHSCRQHAVVNGCAAPRHKAAVCDVQMASGIVKGMFAVSVVIAAIVVHDQTPFKPWYMHSVFNKGG